MFGLLGAPDLLKRDNQFPHCGRYPKGFPRGKYGFTSKATGKRIRCSSRYMPHNGKKEIAKRLRKFNGGEN